MKFQTDSETPPVSCFHWLPGDPLPSGKATEARSPLHLVLMLRKRGTIPPLPRRPTPSRRIPEHPYFYVVGNRSVCSHMTGFPVYCRMASCGFWQLSACSSSNALDCSQFWCSSESYRPPRIIFICAFCLFLRDTRICCACSAGCRWYKYCEPSTRIVYAMCMLTGVDGPDWQKKKKCNTFSQRVQVSRGAVLKRLALSVSSRYYWEPAVQQTVERWPPFI